MKQLILSLTLLFSISFSASALESYDKPIPIDIIITATNGCTYHVTGHIDVSFGWSGPSVDGYSINLESVDGKCPDIKFEGIEAPPTGNTDDGELDQAQINQIVTDIINKELN
ncbi:hypothetical protein SapgrDRAFT_1722 [Saprospira grandis DSM 2844]|uniref:Uncharacterized protein n=1 Tax=Saprospira grandis DSM 2844 TaxID=694433 RepID=J0XWK4_9BACT|nr:hypothetical protein [Saprospira grandis]EJF53426.1 hypothetical protein SapgrDRAFT_1722 [Saprospira grandis DSM 2844]